MELKLKDIEAIYHGALEKEAGRERAAYLDSVCGKNAALRDHVEALLKANEDAGNFLDVPPADLGAALDDAPLTETPGTVIGRYKLLERIGEGGMAVVYMAEQETPIRRKVALKIIKLGMDTKSVIARFEAERQALAMMDHPNIAKVLDAGATETGRPYFVMELVKGVSITDYCDANSLSTKERLELFVQVCNAVQHAHQKGIIHRDIKPTNIMVTQHDGKPVPKVIDFGIAKAVNQRLTEKTLFTRYAHIIGTPAYMSPEQAELSDLDIDTRTDIYSLGVLLYELLTGTTPFGEEELRKAGYIEMQRVIREQEPTKPSTKLSTLGKTLTDIAKRRSATPDVLTKAVRGDLDWIVMKSLEKDRVRRYETANGLALDVQRHLEHEPVIARGPSTTYRLQKFLRRHRSQTVAVLVMVVVASAVAVILSMWNKDRLQLAEAEGFRHRGILSQAREQYAKADRDAALETIKPILESKHVGPEAKLLYAGILVDNRRSGEAVTVLGNLLNERQEIAGAAHSLLARILWESASPDAIVGATLCGCPIHRAATRGRPYDAIEDHRRQAEALLPETAEAYFLRAMTAVTVKEQLASLNEALGLDLQHYESRRLRAYTYYASRKYEEMEHDALVMTILRPRDPLGYSLRAIALRELGKYVEAIAEYDNALAHTLKTDPQYTELSAQRCETLLRMGDYERVIMDAEECLQLSLDKAVFQYYTFSALTALGEYEKANAVFGEIVRRTPTSRNELREWCAKYVFDTLEAGRSWHPSDRKPVGAAFLPMVEAEETYHELSAKGHRVTTDGFSAQWAPDGGKLAFSLGVQGYNGVAIYDPATNQTDLLIVPGKYPKWSPDGQYIAFVRDRQFLRVPEFVAADPKNQPPAGTDEEVWLMKSDGTEPRRLASGAWPCWGHDSTCVYYRSRPDKMLYSISIADQGAEPKRIMPCPGFNPSVSPDNQYVAYMEGTFLKVIDMASHALIVKWPLPSPSNGWGASAWSPDGNELCLGGSGGLEDTTGLWIYRLDRSEPAKTLNGQITVGAWSPDGTKLVFELGAPHFEIWTADRDPNTSTVESLGPARTVEEHLRDVIAFHTRRIEVDPSDAYAYSTRASCYDHLHDRAEANADMTRWSAVVSGKSPTDLQVATPRSIRRTLSGPFGYKIVFSAERPVNETPILTVAFGQKPSGSFVQPGCDSSTKTAKKGRCNMKSFQIPMLSMSLLGLCLLSGLDAPPARADFTFGQPVDVHSDFPYVNPADEWTDCFSADGLEVYFESWGGRPGGCGGPDIWVSNRSSVADKWGAPENLGPLVNSPGLDAHAGISADGLELYFHSNRPGGHGMADIYVARRATRTSPWEASTNLGPLVNTAQRESLPAVSPDGLELYFSSNRPGGYGSTDAYVSTRATKNDPWGAPVNLGPAVNSPGSDDVSSFSPDGLLMVFGSDRPGGFGPQEDGYMTRRASRSAPWQPAVNLGPVVNRGVYNMPLMSADGSALHIIICYPNNSWTEMEAPILPTVDLNADGKVDIADVFIMLEHWLTDYPLCDIAPYAWGDGIVDAQDLVVLAEHIANAPADVNSVSVP